jgi:NADPH2:quinone reductase
LQIIEEKIPEPEPNEVRVKVFVAGVARADTLMRRGQYPESVPAYPFTPGYDVSGVVDAPGKEATKFEPGTPVVALTEVGGYAEYVCLPEDDLIPVPEGLDLAEVVCLGLNYLTAYQMLHRFAKMKTGERALFHAAASGVGTAQLQLGKLLDLEMYGTTSAGKLQLISTLGGIPIDYRNDDFVKYIRTLTGDGVDAAFDPVGGSHIWRSFKSLNKNGKLIAYGEMAITGSQEPKRIDVALHHYLPRVLNFYPGNRKVKWYEAFLENRAHPDWYHQDFATLIDLLQKGRIKPIIAEKIPLVDAVRAHQLLEAAAVKGKIVLICHE